jgi:hypothetical protein
MRGVEGILAGIIRGLLPVEPALAAELRERVERETVAFVASQIRDMPTHLRVPYLWLARGFNWMALRQYARPYTGLDPAKQRDYLSVWIHSTVGFKRDFIKLLRSCSLLFYYDHPEVTRAMEAD